MPAYRFGPFTYHPQTGKLRSSGSEQILRHQVNRLLFLLIQNRNHLLTRQDILAHIWPGEYVEPNNFFQCVNHLRKALGDQANKPQYFQNFRGKGYQWICPVEETRPSLFAKMANLPRPKLGLTAVLGGCLLCLVWWLFHSRTWHSIAPAPKMAPPESVTLGTGSTSTLGNILAGNSTTRPMETPLSTKTEFNVDPLLIPQKTSRSMKVFARARMAYVMGEILHCETLLTMAGQRARALGNSEAEAQSDLVLARISRYRDPKSAKSKVLRVKRHSRASGNEAMYFEACYRLILIHLDLDENGLAGAQLGETRFLATLKTDRQRASAKLVEGVLALRTNNKKRAEAILTDLRAYLQAETSDVMVPQIHLFEAALLFAKAQYDMAAVRTRKARDLLMREGKHPLLELRALWLSYQIETMRGNAREADQLLVRTSQFADRNQFHFFKRAMNGFLADFVWKPDLEKCEEYPAKTGPTLDGSKLEPFPAGFFNL